MGKTEYTVHCISEGIFPTKYDNRHVALEEAKSKTNGTVIVAELIYTKKGFDPSVKILYYKFNQRTKNVQAA